MSDDGYLPIEQVPLADIVAGDPRAARAVLDLLRSMAADFLAEQDAEAEDDGAEVHVEEPTRTRPSLRLVRDEPDDAAKAGRTRPPRVPTNSSEPSQEAVP